MQELALIADIDRETTIYVSPIDNILYREYVDSDNLGGESGYFIMRNRVIEGRNMFDVLAKAVSLTAATELFDMIVARQMEAA